MKLPANGSAYLLAAAVAGGCLILVGSAALAADAQPAAAPAQTPSATAAPTTAAPAPALPETVPFVEPAPAPAEAGLRAYIDPESGQITSIPPEGVDRSIEPSVEIPPTLVQEVLPDGSVMMDLKGTLQDYLILQIGADGTTAVRCTKDPVAAQSAPPAPVREDR